MNRLAVLALALFAIAAPAVVIAADAHTFSDPAMSFTAPADYTPIPVPSHDPAVFADPAIVAAFIKDPAKTTATSITLRMESFEGSYTAFATSTDNSLRSNSDGAFIKRTATQLPNGMPAYWEELTIGSGFDQIKTFQYLWADGVRGVVLSVTGRDGSIGEPQAKRVLGDVSAVAYPKYRY